MAAAAILDLGEMLRRKICYGRTDIDEIRHHNAEWRPFAKYPKIRELGRIPDREIGPTKGAENSWTFYDLDNTA